MLQRAPQHREQRARHLGRPRGARALEHAPSAPVLSKLGPSVKVLMAVGRCMQDAPPALRGRAWQTSLEYSTRTSSSSRFTSERVSVSSSTLSEPPPPA